MRLTISILFITVFSGSCQGDEKNNSVHSILFVGNSLTYTNNLPELVAKIANDNGVAVETTILAYPNYALEDHWNDGQLQKLIANGSFDFVVVQQGPSSHAEGRDMLLDYGERISALCKKHNVQLAFFMVWPAKANYQTFNSVIKNYSDAAQQTQSILCPVGKIWKQHFDTTNNFSYYDTDEFHPSLAGSKVAAQIICNVILGVK